jgi:hypothetical protein
VVDAIYGDGISTGIGSIGLYGLGAGDLAGAVLWSVALYFCSPLQLLLLFLGKIETERPSDWLLRQLGVLCGQRCELNATYRGSMLVLSGSQVRIPNCA